MGRTRSGLPAIRASPTGGTATSKSMTQHAAGTSADGGLRLTTLDGRYYVDLIVEDLVVVAVSVNACG